MPPAKRMTAAEAAVLDAQLPAGLTEEMKDVAFCLFEAMALMDDRLGQERPGQGWINVLEAMANVAVRQLLNEKLSAVAVSLSGQYSEKVIRFISERIHEWDSSEMIGKIENEVGGDLHMIRVNGVVVGAFIGLILGIIRAIVEVAL